MEQINKCHEEKKVPITALCHFMGFPKASYYRKNKQIEIKPFLKQKYVPKNALPAFEKKIVMDLLHCERFVDKTPYEIYYTLLDEEKYFCSPRTMYRYLSENNECIDRRRQKTHRNAIKPELIARHENEVWSWDITKLLSKTRFQYFYLYVILDIYSRYVVGWVIADCESKDIAKKLIQESTLKQGIQPGQLILHADNGPSMRSHSVSQLLEHLGILKTHNRPYTSDDNPFSESQFKTLKYHPQFPERFNSFEEAELFCQQFFHWYNTQHYHSGLCWLTPKSVHYKKGNMILEKRNKVLLKAFEQYPERFNYKKPALKILPDAVYINPPDMIKNNTLQDEENVA